MFFNSDLVSELEADYRLGITDKSRTIDGNARLFYCHLFSPVSLLYGVLRVNSSRVSFVQYQVINVV